MVSDVSPRTCGIRGRKNGTRYIAPSLEDESGCPTDVADPLPGSCDPDKHKHPNGWCAVLDTHKRSRSYGWDTIGTTCSCSTALGSMVGDGSVAGQGA
jgi:hypothetical protein